VTTRQYATVAFVWTLGVCAALLLPLPDTSGPDLFPGLDKVVHAVLFAGLGIFWMRATRRPLLGSDALSLRTRTLFVAAGCGVFAILTEVGQHVLVSTRRGDPGDALADLVGLVLALTAYWIRGEPDSEVRRPQVEG
jgi:VanZ family protein